MNLQATYRQNIFSTVEEMDNAVQAHIYHNATKLSDNYKNILRLLASYSLKTIGTAHLKYDTIAEQVGCSKSTIVRAMKRLKELGIIEVTKGSKRNGIQGADYFHILNFEKQVTMRMATHEMTTRATHEIPCGSKAQDTKNHTESFNSFKTNLNPFVNSYITYSACGVQQDVKEQLRVIYQPHSVEDNHAFEELCKIAFGQLKKYMKSHNMPYLQMTEIIVNCMRSLVNKTGVKNQFALYSAMIKRQVEQLFEAPVEAVKPKRTMYGRKVAPVPEWFITEKERQEKGIQEQPPITQMTASEREDFEKRRAELEKRIAELGA